MKKKFLLAAALTAVALGASAQSNDTIAKVKAAGKVVMGTRESSAPLAYTLGNNQFTGYHVELCQRILKAVFPGTPIEYVAVTSANRIPLVQNGTVDIECGSTTNNLERQKQVDFSVGIFEVGTRLLTKTSSGINDFPDLKGKNVVTTAGTTNERYLKAYNAEHKLGMNVVSAKDHGEAFLMLQSGRAVAFYMDDALLYGEKAKARDPHRWVVVGEPQSREIYACMVRKDDPQFLALVNQTLADLYSSGEIKGIYQRWFEQPIPPKNLNLEFPMTAELQAIIAKPTSEPVQ